MPPMIAADDRRIAGWRVLREYLSAASGAPRLRISRGCAELIRCLPALLCDADRPEDASSQPHAVTHAPEALRYGVMARCPPPVFETSDAFSFGRKSAARIFD